MIHLGLDAKQKDSAVARYCAEYGIRKAFILTPDVFSFHCSFPGSEQVAWEDIIRYKFFYRLLQEIDGSSLVVVNECLRVQDRNCLTYNCIRHFLSQTKHQLIFQYLPIIDSTEDFMILFDLDTSSKWKRSKLADAPLAESHLEVTEVRPTLRPVPVATSTAVKAAYRKEKEKLFANLGLKDPHTIPRNLYLMSGKSKLTQVDPSRHYVGRNNRFKIPTLQTYREEAYPYTPYTVFEFCHNYLDFIDFLSLSRQTDLDVLVADLKVDQWYFERYTAWLGRLHEAYSALQR